MTMRIDVERPRPPKVGHADGIDDRRAAAAGCNSVDAEGEVVHRRAAAACHDYDRECSSLSSLSPPCTRVDSAQFSLDGIDVLISNDCSSGGSSSADNDRVSGDGSSSASDFATAEPIGRPAEINRPANPRPSLSQASSSDGQVNAASGPSSATSSLSLVQKLLGRRRRFPSSIYLPAAIGNDGRDCRHVSISERELYEGLQAEVASLQRQVRDVAAALAGLEAKTKAGRREMLGALASCRGDAKDASLVPVVEGLGSLRIERTRLLREQEEVTKLFDRRRDKLEEMCLTNSFPLPSWQIPNMTNAVPSATKLEGNWFTLTKPTYLDCLGVNSDGNPMYSLGRMSFEMFRPSKLVVSIEAVFNPITEVVRKSGEDELFSVPKALAEEVGLLLEDGAAGEGRRPGLRTYHIVTAFVIEPHSPSFGPDSPNAIVQSPIRGIMTTYGYALPDPAQPDRLSVWFSGGKMECGESRSSPGFKVWKRIFGHEREEGAFSLLPLYSKKRRRPRRTFREGVMVAAATLLMGAQGYDDGMDKASGEMSYSFARPMGGHGKAYVDVLHLDEQTRVMRGHSGTLYVFTRLGGKK